LSHSLKSPEILGDVWAKKTSWGNSKKMGHERGGKVIQVPKIDPYFALGRKGQAFHLFHLAINF